MTRTKLLPVENLATNVQVLAREDDSLFAHYEVNFNVASEVPAPTILCFHGRGDRARIPYAPFAKCGKPLRVFVLQGNVIAGDGNPQLESGYAYTKHYALEGKDLELHRSLEAVARHVRDFCARDRFQTKCLGPPMVYGFSQGAAMALASMIVSPTNFSMALVGAGWVPQSPPATPPLVVRMMHGTDDSIVPFGWGRKLAVQMEEQGHDVVFHAFRGVGHEMNAAMERLAEAYVDAWLQNGPSAGNQLSPCK